jgi:hypothetical protein
MKKLALTLATAFVTFPLIAGAQVKVIEEDYAPSRPAKSLQRQQSMVAPSAVVQEPVDMGLPIDSSDVAVLRSRPFLIRKGVPIHSQIQAWARAKGWQLIWYPSVSWRAIADADFNQHTELTNAIEDVVNILRDEGKPVRLRISDGNHVLEVMTNEVRGDQ